MVAGSKLPIKILNWKQLPIPTLLTLTTGNLPRVGCSSQLQRFRIFLYCILQYILFTSYTIFILFYLVSYIFKLSLYWYSKLKEERINSFKQVWSLTISVLYSALSCKIKRKSISLLHWHLQFSKSHKNWQENTWHHSVLPGWKTKQYQDKANETENILGESICLQKLTSQNYNRKKKRGPVRRKSNLSLTNKPNTKSSTIKRFDQER